MGTTPEAADFSEHAHAPPGRPAAPVGSWTAGAAETRQARPPLSSPEWDRPRQAASRDTSDTAPEDELTAETEESSGIRSPTVGRSVLGGSAASGPTGAALVKLGHDLGDSEVVHQFVCDYLGLFESRLSTLGRALERGDTETALVSILSLESSSAMVGADGVVTAVRGIRDALPQDRQAAGGVLLDRLVDEVDEERRRLDRQGFSCPPAAAG